MAIFQKLTFSTIFEVFDQKSFWIALNSEWVTKISKFLGKVNNPYLSHVGHIKENYAKLTFRNFKSSRPDMAQ